MAKILYVEDNEMNRDMLSRRLSRRGYDIIMAFDGQAGLDMMRNDSPDIVLMDMGLPILDGWEATIQAKADDTISTIPIIALTAGWFQKIAWENRNAAYLIFIFLQFLVSFWKEHPLIHHLS